MIYFLVYALGFLVTLFVVAPYLSVRGTLDDMNHFIFVIGCFIWPLAFPLAFVCFAIYRLMVCPGVWLYCLSVAFFERLKHPPTKPPSELNEAKSTYRHVEVKNERDPARKVEE